MTAVTQLDMNALTCRASEKLARDGRDWDRSLAFLLIQTSIIEREFQMRSKRFFSRQKSSPHAAGKGRSLVQQREHFSRQIGAREAKLLGSREGKTRERQLRLLWIFRRSQQIFYHSPAGIDRGHPRHTINRPRLQSNLAAARFSCSSVATV